MNKVTFTKEQISFLKQNATQVSCNGQSWYYIPFWFNEISDESFHLCLPEKLPDDVTQKIMQLKSLKKEAIDILNKLEIPFNEIDETRIAVNSRHIPDHVDLKEELSIKYCECKRYYGAKADGKCCMCDEPFKPYKPTKS